MGSNFICNFILCSIKHQYYDWYAFIYYAEYCLWNLAIFYSFRTDENDGLRAIKIVFFITVLTGYIGYSDFYSFSENTILQVILLLSLFGLIIFSLIRTFIGFSRSVIRIKAIFGAIVFSLYLLIDFNLIKRKEAVSNDWDTAFEMAFTIYVDLMNLLLEILDAMSNS